MWDGLNDPARWVLPNVIEDMAKQHASKTWITTTDGEEVTFGQMADEVKKTAGYFSSLGISAGDYVGVWMLNGCDFVRAWLGLGRLGAVAVLLNTELRGDFLKHQLNNSGIEHVVVDAHLIPLVHDIADDVDTLKTLVVVGENSTKHAAFQYLDWADWQLATPWDGPGPQPGDTACIMYTSGTSGPSKGVLMPHAHCTLYGIGTIKSMALTPADKYYITLPLFHANGLLMQLGSTLLAGIPALLRRKFSASSWVKDLHQSGATVTNLLGSTAAFVVAQPPSELDQGHRLRAVLNAPNLPVHEQAFRTRFGLSDVVSGFGMTESNMPIWGRIGTSTGNAAGWVHSEHFEVIVAHPETDQEVPYGEIGEILVRPKMPFGFMAGYHNMPEKTVEAWRNLWFHTGDAGTITADGLVTYIDRLKDCIRRRGENISASEIELAVGDLPGIHEVAAYAVPSDLPGAEDEVMLALVMVPGYEKELENIATQMDGLLPRFAKPRFLRLLPELPKTATGKIQRAILKQQGIQDALDRGI
ncbi:AMP-binding protein [Alcaligenaceae bacterium]|nr:AMP-binding protein [Alcaligenaceae bacterium]